MSTTTAPPTPLSAQAVDLRRVLRKRTTNDTGFRSRLRQASLRRASEHHVRHSDETARVR